ncbi:hypothetical protein PS874_04264 [Pseudomonas fluorescens]|nr:hypothetical protein PS874_04264 [Pseudomonas fluorescens]
MRKLTFIVLISVVAPFASASEYCVDQYDSQITNVNSELGGVLKRQAGIDTRLAEIYIQTSKYAQELADAAVKVPPDVNTIQRVGKLIAELNREKTELEAEGFKNQDRIVALKGTIPADLQGKLRGCVEATAPANRLVNLAIQGLAILSTGGASLVLPEKSLYVDMSAVLNGYPTGGKHSVINEAREAALRALPGGLGNPDNDVGKTIRDPGRILRCLFRC